MGMVKTKMQIRPPYCSILLIKIGEGTRASVGSKTKRIPNSVALYAEYPKEALCYVLMLLYQKKSKCKYEKLHST